VARISNWRTAGAGELLMKEGEPGSFFCILADGEVRVTRKGKLLNILHTGECFGEMAYLSKDEQVRGADVTVMEESKIISVPTQKLAQASDVCRHKFDRAFMEILVERLTFANARLSGV
jgi:CRP-like cAMP-binding protein